MKVSKTVVAYIERTVNEKYVERFREINDKMRDRVKKIAPIYEKASKELQEYLDDQANKFLECGIYKELKVEPFNIRVQDYFLDYHLEDYDGELLKLKKEHRKLCAEKEDKIQDIIITLELGGTKADLDRMLAEL